MALWVLCVSMMDGMAGSLGWMGEGDAPHHSTAIHPFKFWWGGKHCSSRPLTDESNRNLGWPSNGKRASAAPCTVWASSSLSLFLLSPLASQRLKSRQKRHCTLPGLATELAPLQRWLPGAIAGDHCDIKGIGGVNRCFCCLWSALRPRETRRRPPWSGQRTDRGVPANVKR